MGCALYFVERLFSQLLGEPPLSPDDYLPLECEYESRDVLHASINARAALCFLERKVVNGEMYIYFPEASASLPRIWWRFSELHCIFRAERSARD